MFLLQPGGYNSMYYFTQVVVGPVDESAINCQLVRLINTFNYSCKRLPIPYDNGRHNESPRTIFIVTNAVNRMSLFRQTTLHYSWSVIHFRLSPLDSVRHSLASSISQQHWHSIPLGMDVHFAHLHQSVIPKHSVKLACLFSYLSF